MKLKHSRRTQYAGSVRKEDELHSGEIEIQAPEMAVTVQNVGEERKTSARNGCEGPKMAQAMSF